MKVKKGIWIFAMGFLSCSLYGQDTFFARKTIESLCSDKFHGRGYYKNGATKSAVYIEKQMKSAGLLPLNFSYSQKFGFDVQVITQIELSSEAANKKSMLKPGVDYVVNPDAPSYLGSVYIEQEFYITEKLFADSGVFDKWFQQFQKSPPQWIIMDTLSAKTMQRFKKQISEIQNACNVVEYTNSKFTWNVGHHRSKYIHIWVGPSALTKPVAGKAFLLKIKSIHKKTLQKNVMGMVPGKLNPDSLIVVCAHYDHLGQMGKNAIFRGANDNAAGIAMMLDLAREYVKNPPNYTMVFMAFAGEEAGLLGSYYYVQNPQHILANTRFVLNLDLVGTGETGMTVVNATVFPKEFQLLDSINKMNHYLPEIRKRGKAANSDHYFFTELGIPSFFWYQSGPRGAYHDVFDIPETLTLQGYVGTYLLTRQFFKALGN